MYEELVYQIEQLKKRLDYLESVEMANTDYYLEVARGNVTGMTALNKFGSNSDIDTGTEDVWTGGGTWVAPTTARVHDIVSSSASDDGSPAGTGAQTITISGLDANWLEISEVVTMNGTTNVATANSYIIIYRMQVTTAGSSGTNVGTITATAQTDATVTASINATLGQTLMAIWQVPANKSLYITKYYASCDGTVSSQIGAVLWVADYDGDSYVKKVKHIQAFSNGQQFIYEFNPPFKVNAKSRVWISVTVTANNQNVNAGFDGVYG